MRKKQDIMWEQSTLWESVEKWVTKYLIMTFSYGRMLAQLKNEMLNEDSRASTHLIEIDDSQYKVTVKFAEKSGSV